MRKLLVVVSLLVPMIASADDLKAPEKTAAFASWTPGQQWAAQLGDHGYSSDPGLLLWADEMGDKLSELGRAKLVSNCFMRSTPDMKSLMTWALCGPDAKALDLKKLEAELVAEKVSDDTKTDILDSAKRGLERAQKIGAIVDAAAKDDPGVQQVLKLTETARSEWTTYLAKNKASFDLYISLKDAVRSGKSNHAAFKDCYAQTQPAFEKHVKALAAKIPWDVGRYIPGYMSYLTATTEGYITTVAWAACAWGYHESGIGPYSGAASGEDGAQYKAGWRTIALGKLLAATPKFADRNIRGLETFNWKYGVLPAGTTVAAPIMTPDEGVVSKITKKDDTVSTISFKKDKVEKCLSWKETDRVTSISAGGNVQYDHVCQKRGMVDTQNEPTDVPTRYLEGTKPGDILGVVNHFPCVSWKGKKLTMLFGVKL